MESKIEQTGAVVPVEDEQTEAVEQPEPSDAATDADAGAGIPSSGTDAEQADAASTVPPSGDDNGTVPEPPQQITEAMLRKLRAKCFTVRHNRLEQCGHKYDQINEPQHRNCENCWFQWLNTHPQLVEVTDQFLRTHGERALIGMRGVKYVKMFRRYMSTVIHLMKEEGRLNGANGEGRVGSTLVSGEEVGTDGSTGSSVEGGETEDSGHVEQVFEQAIRDAVVAEAGQEETSSPTVYID